MDPQKPIGRHPRKPEPPTSESEKVKPSLRRRDKVRAWILIILGLALTITGIVLAIHKFTILDAIPVALGVAMMVVGFRYLRQRDA